MLAATAKVAMRHDCPCEVSVERVMGCGMGGCYSCVVPMRGDDGAWHHVRSCLAGPVLDGRSDRVGLMSAPDLSVRIGSLTLKNPLIAASGCFGYGVEYADLVDLSTLGAIAVEGTVPRRTRRPSGAAHRRNARRHAERDRAARHRRHAASSTKSCRSFARAARPSSSTSAARRSTSTPKCRGSCRMRRASPPSS